MNNETETNETNEKNVFQRISRKIADGIKRIGFFIFFNPLLMITLGFIVGGRLYEGGFLGIKGTTVWVSGVCETRDGIVRDDLAQDQAIVSSVDNESIKIMLRKTRDSLVCKYSDVTIDRWGPLDDFFKPKVTIPELKKMDKTKMVKDDYSKYENKKLLVSGLCTDSSNQKLPPFRDKVVDITNVKQSSLDPSIHYFTGIRDDDVAVVCNTKDITYDFYYEDNSSFNKEEEIPTNKGKTVFITGLCFPDKAIYDKIGSKNYLPFYDMQKLPVEVTEDKYGKKEGRIVALRGSILDKNIYKGKSIFGHKIVCDEKDGPLNISSTDETGIEQFNSTEQKK
jgi:hypothetical protein